MSVKTWGLPDRFSGDGIREGSKREPAGGTAQDAIDSRLEELSLDRRYCYIEFYFSVVVLLHNLSYSKNNYLYLNKEAHERYSTVRDHLNCVWCYCSPGTAAPQLSDRSLLDHDRPVEY